jgi:tetratricopeptide (TPR) repeat protein
VGGDGELARGREAAGRLAWADAYTALSLADRSSSLAGKDLELLATAAYLLGRVNDCLRALQRAQQLHAERGDLRRAARCAFWLVFHLINQGELTQASGWLARANRLLEHEQECAERGYLLLPVALQHVVAGDYAGARRTATRAAAIGRHAGEADLVALALQLRGRAMVREGRVNEGLVLLDETMVAVVAGELSPPAAGTVYCSVIDACQEIMEWRRAHEWTAALAAWCG